MEDNPVKSQKTMRILELWLKLWGFKVDSELVVNTTTKLAEWSCNMGVRDGRFVKLRKNRYKLVN